MIRVHQVGISVFSQNYFFASEGILELLKQPPSEQKKQEPVHLYRSMRPGSTVDGLDDLDDLGYLNRGLPEEHITQNLVLKYT